MTDVESGLQDIAEIRTMMERASKFLTLSGLSGIGAGLIALAGVAAARALLGSWGIPPGPAELPPGLPLQLGLLGAAVLVLGLATALLFSVRLARRRGGPLWTPAARVLLAALALPFLAGGVLSLLLLVQGNLWLIPGLLLLFYGTGLSAAGSVTFGEIRYLGIVQVVLGLAAILAPGHSLLFWGAGFGLLHMVYGVFLYLRYES